MNTLIIRYMRAKIVTILSVISLIFPMFAWAYVDASLDVSTSYATGTDAQFDVVLNNFSALNDTVSVLTILGAASSDIKSASFLDQTGWVTLTPYQSGQDVLAKFISDTGVTVNNKRVITIRLNFYVPRNYVIGYTLQTNDGQVLSAAAAPLSVTGSVLGTSTTATKTNFTRSLTFGKTGDDVKSLQQRLTQEGLYSGPITGTFGRLTQAAVIKYQKLKNIKPANGVVGPQTQAALNQ